jgi:MFS family permease
MSGSRNRPLFFAGMLSGNLAYQIQSVAVAWHVFSLAHRPFDLGLAGLALFLPTFAFALPSGVLADRVDRRVIVALTSIFEGIAISGFALAVILHVTSIVVYLAIIFAIGTTQALGSPATRSLLPTIVPASEYLRTQAAFSSLRQLTVIGGPALGGLLVAISTPLALGASTLLTLTAAALLGMLRIERNVERNPPSLRDALDGLHFIFAHKIVLAAISLDLFAVLFGGATALLPAFATTIFHMGPTGLGVLRSSPAVGAAVVAALIARRPLGRNVGRTLLIAVTGFGIATIVFGLSKNFALSIAMLVIVGATDMVSVVIRNGLVQLSTPDAMRGRVSAVENVFIGASNEFGDFESGTLAAFVGIVPAVVAGGIGTLLVIGLWAIFFPALRNADRFIDLPAVPIAPEEPELVENARV